MCPFSTLLSYIAGLHCNRGRGPKGLAREAHRTRVRHFPWMIPAAPQVFVGLWSLWNLRYVSEQTCARDRVAEVSSTLGSIPASLALAASGAPDVA